VEEHYNHLAVKKPSKRNVLAGWEKKITFCFMTDAWNFLHSEILGPIHREMFSLSGTCTSLPWK